MKAISVYGEPHPCGYLSGQIATEEFRFVQNPDPKWYGLALERGWRRFGWNFFRPACTGCAQCIGLRIPVAKFTPNRSQRRNLKLNSDLEVVIRAPSLTQAHLELYERFHRNREEHRGWRPHESSPATYKRSFLNGSENCGRELLYLLNGRLVGVALTDVLATAASSVYFFHDPALRHRGLGIFSVLKQLELAAQAGLEFQYLGFWIGNCQSMNYKRQFEPHQLLVGRPSDQEQPIWHQPPSES